MKNSKRIAALFLCMFIIAASVITSSASQTRFTPKVGDTFTISHFDPTGYYSGAWWICNDYGNWVDNDQYVKITGSNRYSCTIKVLKYKSADIRVKHHYNTKDYNGSISNHNLYFTIAIQAPEYTITFNPNGGSGGNRTVKVKANEKIGNRIPSAPSRSGYSFTGWYTNNGAKITSNSTFTGNTTVYARWSQNSGGSNNNSSSPSKKANTIKVTSKNSTASFKTLKKKAVTKKLITVKNAKGKVTYKKSSGSKYLTVNKSNGKITVKKKTKKGTYKIKVKVTAAGNSTYYSKSITKTISIKVK